MVVVGGGSADLAPTEFVGYTELQKEGQVAALLCERQVEGQEATREMADAAGCGEEIEVVLDITPFYAESGGQVGDWGRLEVEGGGGVLSVTGTRKDRGGVWMHQARVEEGQVAVGDRVVATVDGRLRKRAQAHHTATHLLQAALKEVIGSDTSQAGSLVAFDRLRFDFNSPRGLTAEEVERVEGMVNGWIEEAVPLTTRVMPLAEARKAGATAMFGEKYGEEVRGSCGSWGMSVLTSET